MIVEVAHPSITVDYGTNFLTSGADYFCGSPTVFANLSIEQAMRETATSNKDGRSLYLPAGALWGSNDIQKMAARKTLTGENTTLVPQRHTNKMLHFFVLSFLVPSSHTPLSFVSVH